MRIFLRYLMLYLAAAFFFIFFNSILDRLFAFIDYGTAERVGSGSSYVGFFITLYTPWLFPFLIVYNIVVNELLTQPDVVKEKQLLRYAIAVFLGLSLGFFIGRGGFSIYIGEFRAIKSICLFGLLMLSIEFTRDIVLKLRHSKRK